MIYITEVSLSGGNQHHHITHVKWFNSENTQSGISSTAEMVTFIEKGNKVQVKVGPFVVDVKVVVAYPKYLRTHQDGTETDNLLNLPRF